MEIKKPICKLVLPWAAMIITKFKCEKHPYLNRLLDKLIIAAEK